MQGLLEFNRFQKFKNIYAAAAKTDQLDQLGCMCLDYIAVASQKLLNHKIGC